LGLAPGQLVGEKAEGAPRGILRNAETLRRALAGERFHVREQIAGIHWDLQVAPLEDASGKKEGCIGTALEVGAEAAPQASKAAQERLDVLTALLEASPQAYLVADAEGKVTFGGGGAFAGLGLDPKETTGRRLEELTPEPGDWQEALDKAQQDGSAPVAWRSSGEPFKGRLTALKDPQGGRMGFGSVLWPVRETPEGPPRTGGAWRRPLRRPSCR
jgi:PAS domain-containing protein